MTLLTYLEARKQIQDWQGTYQIILSEQKIEQVIAWSGRKTEWINLALDWVSSDKGHDSVVWVEETGIGQQVANISVAEQLYLYNPSLAMHKSILVKMDIIVDGRLVSTALLAWLRAQSKEGLFRLSDRSFTGQEARMICLLFSRRDSVVEREEIARALWGEQWVERYSDWEIDGLTARLRKKLAIGWQIVTVRGRGYVLSGTEKSQAPDKALRREVPMIISNSILPTDEYLAYMNDAGRVRKVYSDLFRSMEQVKIKLGKVRQILCINSYSYDNVDAVVAWVKKQGWQDVRVYFVHYDQRAIDMHQERIKELGASSWVEVWHDDIRESKLKGASFDLVVNDFRLNFNLNHMQNLAMLEEMCRIADPGGSAVVSVVVDGRYESERYGKDQEHAPINATHPALFQGDEHLIRRCWSVPYYKDVFRRAGWCVEREFDIEEGKTWTKRLTTTVDPRKGAFYRRFLLRKIS